MKKHTSGFSLLELLTIITILALLAAISVPVYRSYVERARASEIVLRYDAVRTGLQANLSTGEVSDCAEIIAASGMENLGDDYARLSVGFDAVSGGNLQGYKPVFLVCASQDIQGELGVRVARAAYDEFSLTNIVNPGAVVSESMVSFSVPLSSGDVAACRVPVGGALTACGARAPVPTATAMAVPSIPAPAVVAVPTAQVAAVPQPLAPMSESVSTDFSQPPLGGQANMFIDPAVWGWKTDNSDGKVEYGRGSTYGDTSGGNAGIVELEGRAGDASNLYREIATQPGAQYTFSFDLSGRVGTSSESAAVEVIWEGQVVDTLRPAGNTFGFRSHTYNLLATQAGSRIELRAVTQDGAGPIVDNLDMAFTGMAGSSN